LDHGSTRHAARARSRPLQCGAAAAQGIHSAERRHGNVCLSPRARHRASRGAANLDARTIRTDRTRAHPLPEPPIRPALRARARAGASRTGRRGFMAAADAVKKKRTLAKGAKLAKKRGKRIPSFVAPAEAGVQVYARMARRVFAIGVGEQYRCSPPSEPYGRFSRIRLSGQWLSTSRLAFKSVS